MPSFSWNVALTSGEVAEGGQTSTSPELLPRDIALDLDTGDLDLRTGDLRLNFGAEGVAQAVRIGLGEWLGEWFLDEAVGTDYVGRVFVKGVDPNGLRSHFRDRILSRVGVGEVPSVTAEIDTPTRHLTVAAVAKTDFGEITIELAAEPP